MCTKVTVIYQLWDLKKLVGLLLTTNFSTNYTWHAQQQKLVGVVFFWNKNVVSTDHKLVNRTCAEGLRLCYTIGAVLWCHSTSIYLMNCGILQEASSPNRTLDLASALKIGSKYYLPLSKVGLWSSKIDLKPKKL